MVGRYPGWVWLALALIDRIFPVEELPWQAHALAPLAVVRVVTVNLYETDPWRGIHFRFITVAIVIACLYSIARWIRLPQSLGDIDVRHAYTWVASGLTAWLMWAELQPVGLAVAWAVFGLILFEIAQWKNQVHLRWQAFLALAGAFARIFFVNLTAEPAAGEHITPAFTASFRWRSSISTSGAGCDRQRRRRPRNTGTRPTSSPTSEPPA